MISLSYIKYAIIDFYIINEKLNIEYNKKLQTKIKLSYFREPKIYISEILSKIIIVINGK